MIGPTGEGLAGVERALARSLGKAACLYGHPLVELMRACRLQTRSRFDSSGSDRAPMNALHCSAHPPVQPGTPWLPDASGHYVTAWIHLGDGPRLLCVPASTTAAGPLMLRLQDARADVLLSFQCEERAPGFDLVLVGPNGDAPALATNQVLVTSFTDLVWLVIFTPAADNAVDTAIGLQTEIRLEGAPVGPLQRRPPAVELWAGDDSDAFVDLLERDAPAAVVAATFYANLCRALAHAPPNEEDRTLLVSLRRVGLGPNAALEWQQLQPQTRAGLIEGFEEAARCAQCSAVAFRSKTELDFNLDDPAPETRCVSGPAP